MPVQKKTYSLLTKERSMPVTSELIDKFEKFINKDRHEDNRDSNFPIAVYVFPGHRDKNQIPELKLIGSSKEIEVGMKFRVLAVKCTREKLETLIKIDEEIKAPLLKELNKELSSAEFVEQAVKKSSETKN